MTGETDLGRMLAGLEPQLCPVEYGYGLIAGPQAKVPAGLDPTATMREAEGLTVIAPCAALLRHGIPHRGGFARISLHVHSDLGAVGLTAAFSTALARNGLAANVVAGFHHDHIFTDWDRRHEALACLQALAG